MFKKSWEKGRTWLGLDRERVGSFLRSAIEARSIDMASGLGRIISKASSTIVRQLFDSCSSPVRLVVEALSKASRTPPEGLSKQSRSSLEQESKSSRRKVEEQSITSQSRGENAAFQKGGRTKVELTIIHNPSRSFAVRTRLSTLIELSMNFL